jgi:glutamate synthase domain-containing protein 1/glutamate synthase domain-containing protein 3/glutamate synthase domain-containing protein 2
MSGLLDPRFEHDGGGVGFLADLGGAPSARILPLALLALERMTHRGAVDPDGRTGDGAGVITQVPWDVLRAELPPGPRMPSGRREDLGVGMLFLPLDRAGSLRAREAVTEALAAEGLTVRGWREVPVREEALGEKAWRSRPQIEQVFVERPAEWSADHFEGRLYRARRGMESLSRARRLDAFYVVSLSHRTIVYKAMVRGGDLPDFYLDLRHPDFASAFAVFHQRFSTNTVPSWSMTQPFRLLAHDGEINTIEGNRSWMRAREASLASARLGIAPGALSPLLAAGVSDSASLDEALGLLTAAGRGVLHGMSLLAPPAWEGDAEMTGEVRDFFDYQSGVLEPWDGPSLAVFTDGRTVGASLDRNGLRPARSLVTVDGLVMVASEVGLLAVEEERVLRRGRLGPGDVVAVDLRAGRFLDREAIHRSLAAGRPYGRWLREHRVTLDRVRAAAPGESGADPETPDLGLLRAFGYAREERDDTSLAVLSSRPRLLYSYFKQRFAQVTSPPIDPLRESTVMSLLVHLGPKGNLLDEAPEHAAQVQLPGPFLDGRDLASLRAWDGAGFRARTLGLLFRAEGGEVAFRRALDELLREAVRAVEAGATLLILSDRGVDATHAALPMLLAVATVHQHLVGAGLRLRTSLIAETGEARDDHQMACLLGYGASAIHPYLALATVRQAVRDAGGEPADEASAEERFRSALTKGLLETLSKMGISTLRSYHGAQLFEAVGVGLEVVQRSFTGTPSAIGGVGLGHLAGEVLARHAGAFGAAGGGLEEGSSAGLTHRRDPIVLRDLLEFRLGQGIPLPEVEPVEAIVKRFATTAAMSPRALSPEAHEVLATDLDSIEDLARLIYDLKSVNAAATVRVKLVSQVGVGTIAAGVAKAHADAIVIAGHDGGVGASPLGSIANAGTPWELGLAEAQQALVRGGLRGRVRLQVEGGLTTGRDVVMAALFGADEFSFFRGTPEPLVRSFTAVAEEVREVLALLGYRRLQDVIGRTDLVEARPVRPGSKAAAITLRHLLSGPGTEAGAIRHEGGRRNEPPITGQNLDQLALGRLRFQGDGVRPIEMALPIGNTDRAVGARIVGELTQRFRGRPLAEETIRLQFRGAAGQGFGAFCGDGLHLRLEGEANDGLGKGMSGGEITLFPSRAFASRAEGEVIAGNTILCGATGGRAFIAGRVGERFAARNRGALSVVEGVGDHACERMAGGAVVVLGPFGRNFGAGMSGGLAYVFDPEERLARRANLETVTVEAGVPAEDEAWLHEAVLRHAEATGSALAARLLTTWSEARPCFRRVAPKSAPAARPAAWPPKFVPAAAEAAVASGVEEARFA